jgi:hypothetical protein
VGDRHALQKFQTNYLSYFSDRIKYTVDVSTSYLVTSLNRPLGLQRVEAPGISRQSAHEGDKVVSPTHRPPLPAGKDFWYSFLLEAESTPVLLEGLYRESNLRPSGL